ncbi:MAG: hypothetical protein Q9194_003798 [Teloschistes cf. exilis]
MGFFKSLKGDHPDTIGSDSSQTYAPPPGPPPGPPPSHQRRTDEQFAPPPGPPPSKNDYLSPSGPPPNHGDFVPPPGPPPSHAQSSVDPPPYHDWTVIEDTALLPPPPSLGYTNSPAGNASLSDADRAHEWCRMHPLIKPHQPAPVQYNSVTHGDISLVKPREYQGSISKKSMGSWAGSTIPGGQDACLLSALPCYFPVMDSPLVTRTSKIIYFEVKIKSYGRGRGDDASSLALGYCAVPYPTWRMPGWERGSLAVHGDDGRRYVNDTWGGKDFTSAIHAGETVGLGMEFSVPDTPPDYRNSLANTSNIKVDVFFTRNGSKESGWNLHEELDAEKDLGVDGIDGQFDLYAAIGLFGSVDFEQSILALAPSLTFISRTTSETGGDKVGKRHEDLVCLPLQLHSGLI